jgi:hypothetical protein
MALGWRSDTDALSVDVTSFQWLTAGIALLGLAVLSLAWQMFAWRLTGSVVKVELREMFAVGGVAPTGVLDSAGTLDDLAFDRYCLNQAKAPVTGVTFDPVTGVRRSTAYRIRTGVTAVRGRRPRPLDECGTVAPRRADSSKRRLDAGWSRRGELRSQPLGKQLAHPRPLVVGDRVPG